MDSLKTPLTNNATDVSDTEGNQLTLRRRLYLALMDALSALSFESKIIDDFYLYVSASHSKKHFRLALNFIIFNCLYLMLIVPYSGGEDSFTMKYFGLLVMVAAIILYIASIGFLSPSQYQPISLIIITLYLSLHIYSHKTVSSNANYNYVLPVEMFLIIFAWLPFSIDVSLSLCLVYSIVFTSFVEFRMIDFHQADISAQKHGTNWTVDGKYLNETSFFKTELELKFYPRGILLQCLFLHILGIYIHYSNRLRRRASFLRLGESVKSQIKRKNTFDSVMKYIGSIMPASVRDMYWEERKNMDTDDLWVFSNNYDNVTILFTDMVGFTGMNLNKSATEVVDLLNDLYNRFDRGCELTNCEKIGTIGDCYYCVAGCPNSRSDHAACCIEAAFKMFSEMKAFNLEKNETLNMRIGIHTGRINGAIIGKLKFKFDVYSNDVIITKKIASTSRSGLVRISATTYNLVNCIYTVDKAPSIEILREVSGGLQGMLLKNQTLETFFILRREVIVASRNYRCQNEIQNSLLGQNRTLSDDSNDDDSIRENVDKINLSDPYHIFVHHVATDPDQIIKLFSWLPVHYIFLNFIDSELETSYQNHFHDYLTEVTVDSSKLAPLTDTIASLICSFIIFLSAWCAASNFVNQLWYIFLGYFFVAVLFTIFIGTVTTYNPILRTGKIVKLFRAASNRIIRSILLTYMSSLPCLFTLTLYKSDLFYKDYHYTIFLIGLFTVSLLNFVLASPVLLTIKMIVMVVIVVISIVRLFIFENDSLTPFNNFCDDNVWIEIGVRSSFQIFLNFVMVVFLNRENQKNLRLCFYITKIIRKRELDMSKKVNDAETMLFNIIPRYVMNKISIRNGDVLIIDNLHYANAIKNAGIGFACLSNFFSKYYQESYQGGKSALRLLNKVVCMFDDLISEYGTDVEKIKTFNDCYVFAAGLCEDKDTKVTDLKRHMYMCIQFSFGMMTKLKEFNQDYIFGNDKFELKVGMNVGPVTAGLIGATKPTYDIWGDAVTVAGHVCSAATAGNIFVTKFFLKYLSQLCEFVTLGEFPIKGIGNMELYLCKRIINKNFLNEQSDTNSGSSYTKETDDSSSDS